MKNRTIIVAPVAVMVMAGILIGRTMVSCQQNKPKTSTTDKEILTDSLDQDTALYGVLGEGTGMSCIEIITGKDTLILNKSNEKTQTYGNIFGSMGIYGDSLTITADLEKEHILNAVNLTELCKVWISTENHDTLNLSLKNNKTTQALWKMHNTRIVYSSKGVQDYDTLEIKELMDDTLVVLKNNKTCIYSEEK